MTLDLGITRRQRYVSTATAANVTSSVYAQGGTITSYTYSGTTYIAHIFTVTGFFTVTSTINNLEFLAVAGGGGGGQSANSSAGGGGGGGIVNGASLVPINRAYASSAFLAVTTSTQANVVGGWVDGPGQTDFTGGNGFFLYSWSAVQQTNGGARTMPLMEAGAYNNVSPQNYYMEIGISSISPANVGIGLIRDGAPLSGWNNVPYINLSTGVVANFQGVGNITLGAFQPGDTLQILWDSRYMVGGQGTYWWVGRNNTWNSTPISDTANAGNSTGTYKIGALRLIFMCTAAGGGTMRGQFRSGLENKFAPPGSSAIPSFTFTNYTGYYTNPLGTGYIASGTTFGVTVGAGGGVGSFNPTTSASANGNNGGDTIIYNATNASSYYSVYFANSIITATNSAFSFGTNDFSIETWMYPTSTYGRNVTYNYRPIFDSRDFNNRGGDVPNRGFVVYLGLYNNVGIYTSGTTYLTTVNTVTNAAWSHVAVARINGVMNVWINGIKDGNVFITTSTVDFHNFTNTNIRIGYGSISQDWSISSFYTGYLSNYRIVNGISAYHNPGIIRLAAPLTATQNANVNGNPSTAISGTSTSLLMLTTSTGGGAFYDSSLGTTATLTNNNVVTVSGSGPGTYSGSLLFNGTNQWLSNATSTAFTFGTNDFTVEYWIYYNTITAGTTYVVCGNGRSGSGYFFGSLGFIPYMSTSLVGYQATTAGTFKVLQWTHVAFARSGTTINVYINGSWTYSYYNMVDNITETGFTIGARSDPAFYVNAYISNLRVVKGVALYTYTGNFTPPTTVTSATQSSAVFYPGPANLPSVVAVNTITTQTVLLAFNTATIGNISTLTIALNQTSGTVTVSTFAPFTTSTEIVRAFGGGGGGGQYQQNGGSGGSGGGASGNGWGGTPVPGQGKAGGQGSQSLASGGGGYSTIGGPGLNEGTWPVAGNPAGAGGDGGYFNHSGAMIAYSGGGGGGSWTTNGWTVGPGGAGGGGNGAYVGASQINATAGVINSGGGGGGANNTSAPNYNAAAGGSGIVIFRYPANIGDAVRFPSGLTDPYLKNTTLLLSGQYGQNTSTNNTIIDNSYNNISINTASITITQGTFSPYGPLWSTSFNGSTDYLTFVSTGTSFALNSFFGLNKSFTIEAWINPNNIQTSNTATVILGDASPTTGGLAWSVGLDSSNKPMIYWNDSVGRNFITATNTLSTGTWNHVAWISYAGTPTMYVNGIFQAPTVSASTTLTNATQTLGIVMGAHWNKFYNGSISNLRVSTSAIYTPSLTSAYFNGVNQYISSATSTAVTFGTNNFTVEFWVYWIVLPTTGNYHQIVGRAATANGVAFGAASGAWYMTTFTTAYNSGVAINTGQWYHVAWVRNSGSVTLYIDGISRYTTAFATNITDTGVFIGGSGNAAQYANAVVSNIRVLNGTALYTSTPFTVPTPNLTNITNTTLLTLLTTSTTFTDYSSTPALLTSTGNVLLVGLLPTSVSTSTFAVPVTPFNTPANTILLTNNSNRFIDISTSSISITTGTITSIPRIQRQSPFTLGYPYTPITIGNSASFNGFTDYLYTNTGTVASPITTTFLQLDSDFTIECWVYTTSTAAQCIFDLAGKDGNTLRPNSFALNMGTAGVLSFNYNNTTSTNSLRGITPYTWNHIAVTRSSNIMSLWQNGNLTLSVFTSTNFSNGQITIGKNGTTSTFFFGAISDFRIVKGQSLYNSTFNPPVAPLKPIDTGTSTSLLLNFNNASIIDATMNHNIIIINTATTSSNIVKYNPKTMYFPGVSDYLTITPISTASYALGISDFTVEMWIYVLPFAGWLPANLQPTTFRSIFDMRTTNTANAGFDIYLGNTGTLNVGTLGLEYIRSTTLVPVNTWHHVALVRQSNTFTLYLNGFTEGIYSSATPNFINPITRIGFGAQGNYFNGYIDEVRVTRGVARYTTSTFLVPQKSLPVK